MPNLIDYSGQRFGLLVVIERAGSAGRSVLWRCLCDCGNEAVIRAGNLRSGNSQSCGCQRNLATAARSTTHGQSVGYKSTPEHLAWKQALNRCRNNKLKCWKNYGGRGITMHPEWEASFQAFFDHIGRRPSPAHSLDRIENDRGYEPGNVRWATKREQSLNQRPKRTARKPQGYLIDVDGVPMRVKDAAAKFGLNAKTVYHRIWSGCSDAEALKPYIRKRRGRAINTSQ